jgi:hypothetical protein
MEQVGSRASRHRGNPYAAIPAAARAAGLLFGAGAFLLLGILMGLDYSSVRGVPTERAVVVSVGPSGTHELCGYRALIPDTPGELTTYRSLNPPTGLPAVFTHVGCPSEQVPGGEVPVRRTGLGAGDVHLEPIESPGDVVAMAMIGALTAGVVGAGLAGVREAWGVRQSQRRLLRSAQRRTQGPGRA